MKLITAIITVGCSTVKLPDVLTQPPVITLAGKHHCPCTTKKDSCLETCTEHFPEVLQRGCISRTQIFETVAPDIFRNFS